MRILSLIVVFFCSSFLIGQERIKVSGFVRDSLSKETLIGVSVFNEMGKMGCVTNSYGHYSIEIPKNASYLLKFSYVGYQAYVKIFNLRENTQFDLYLKPQSAQIAMIEVNANQIPSNSVNRIDQKTISILPALLGEKDALKILQFLPGVARGNEGNTGLFVRGGNADQNLTLLDEAPVYNVNHFFGLFSAFHGAAIKDMTFYKGNFPTRYGGRLSSVTDITMAEGNRNKWQGEGGVGILSSRFLIQGPIIKNKASILLSARRSYFDLLLSPFLKLSGSDAFTAYFFHDFNAKVNISLSNSDQLMLSSYAGQDQYRFSSVADVINKDVKNRIKLGWQNLTTALRWNHANRNGGFLNTSLILNGYNFNTKSNVYIGKNPNGALFQNTSILSSIRDISLKHENTWIYKRQILRFGGSITNHNFHPNSFVYQDDNNPLNNINIKSTLNAQDGVVFAEDKISLNSDKIEVVGGIRMGIFKFSDYQTVRPEPRIKITYQISKSQNFSIGYSQMNQYLQLISNTGVSFPTDLWIPSTKKIQPQHSDLVNLGYVRSFLANNWSIAIETYYKKMQKIAGYKEGIAFIELEPESVKPIVIDWENAITQGKGIAWGLECMLQKKNGRLTGWVAYTLSSTRHTFPEINLGKTFYPFFDRRHNLSTIAIFNLSKRICLSANWVFSSPNPVPIPIAGIPTWTHEVYGESEIGTLPYFGNRGSVRGRSYHRLDVAIQLKKQKKRFLRTWEFGLYNAYNRKNPFYYTTFEKEVSTGKNQLNVKSVTIFPIIPSFSYNFTF
jgi:CarboxypepD_reg-like domain/TonB-dependent Receptor Plug Domain